VSEQPAYYARLVPEPLDVIEAWGLGFSLGCVVKYCARAGHKPGEDAVADLKKARFYIDREIARLEARHGA
jgi:hypothetical protein